jgi:hypothetical protein
MERPVPEVAPPIEPFFEPYDLEIGVDYGEEDM